MGYNISNANRDSDWFRLETMDDSLQPTIDMLLNLSVFMWFGGLSLVILPEQQRDSNLSAHLPGSIDPPSPPPPDRLRHAQVDPANRPRRSGCIRRLLWSHRGGRYLLPVSQP